MSHKEKWLYMYDLAKAYYKHHGHLNVPKNFKTINGYEEATTGPDLGVWIMNQRRAYSNRFKNKEDIKNKLLPLTDEEVRLLLEIGMIFNLHEGKWKYMYSLAKAYYEYHGHLDVPTRFKTINGYKEDDSGPNLGGWICTQIKAYENHFKQKEDIKNKLLPLTDEEVRLLLEIGINFNPIENRWLYMYSLAKAYYEHHGHLNVRARFKTINGYEEATTGPDLGGWICTQRKAYENRLNKKDDIKNKLLPLTDEQIQLLFAIKIDFNPIETRWNHMYSLAEAYYEYHGHLNVPAKFKTINGYEEDNKHGLDLGNWIIDQRIAYSNRFKKKEGLKNRLRALSDERLKKLLKIHMIFNVTKNRDNIDILCTQYKIDLEIREKLKKLVYQEVVVKLNYLLENNLPIVVNQQPHEIFYTSNLHMQVKYGIDIEELMEQYYHHSGKQLVK